jgi:outer membrane protein assembly factor BamB/predicted MPP superfamily phosphohydrolase
MKDKFFLCRLLKKFYPGCYLATILMVFIHLSFLTCRMKKLSLLVSLLLTVFLLHAQTKPFRFIHISDTHIGSPDGKAEEDLKRTVADINGIGDVAFVIITGDITELGTNEQLKRAKEILDSLHVKYYIIPGNHDSGWSESGGAGFTRAFGSDKFMFDYNGIRFIGCASGPYVRMSDGHIPRDAIVWLDGILKNTPRDQPLIFLNHYPIDNSLDNWYEITDRLRPYNILAILCGHGHANKAMNFEGIPGVMGRSNLRARADVGGFNIVDIRNDSIIYTERRPGTATLPSWTSVEIKKKNFDPAKKFNRPDYSINKKYPQVRTIWTYSADANIISTPATTNDLAIVGDQNGKIMAVSLKNGKQKWSYQAGSSIFSSPAISKNKLIVGSCDGYVYCLSSSDGKLIWKKETGSSVLGSPVVNGDTVFIGSSDHSFYALHLNSGNVIWQFTGLVGPVVSTPLLYNGDVIFGAWDKNLYAVNRSDGTLSWKWNNGSPVINYSPAACTPVAYNGVVYIVAPDRYLSAIDATDGKTLWRNNEATVRESIGISNDGKMLYGKTMQDTVVAYLTSRQPQHPYWKMNCGFGYEHVPSMLVEKDGQVFFGTRNGVVYCIDPLKQRINWAHKIDNSMVNTLRVIDGRHVIASTMDGKMALLEINY